MFQVSGGNFRMVSGAKWIRWEARVPIDLGVTPKWGRETLSLLILLPTWSRFHGNIFLNVQEEVT